MASEIPTYGQVSLNLQNLASIVSSALELTLSPPEYRDVYQFAPKLPDGVSDWEYFDPIGIGHFDEDGDCPVNEAAALPVATFKCDVLTSMDSTGRSIPSSLMKKEDQGSDYGSEPSAGPWSSKMVINCNFFVLRGCSEYLRVWLDQSLPQRAASSLSLEGELYETINSRYEIRDDSSLFPNFQYGDIPKTLEQD